MSYVSNTGLSHYHEKMKALLAGKSNTNHTHDLSAMINTLSNGTSTPVDADYYISQYVGGGETEKTYYRRPMSALYAYIKGKTDTLYAAKSHTHNYAGSSSAGGVANSAAKLATARTIASTSSSLISFSAKFDGSGDVTGVLVPRCCRAYVNNKNNYPYHRIATYNTNASWNDAMITILIPGGYQGAPFGIVNITVRTNNKFNDNVATVQWIVRNGFNVADVIAASYTASDKVYVDVYIKTPTAYAGQIIQVLAGGGRGSLEQKFTLINSEEYNDTTTSDSKGSKESYVSLAAAGTALYKAAYTKTVTGVDAGTVSYANSTNAANKATQDSAGQQINTTYIKSISTSGTSFTINKGNNTTSTISADCMTNTEIDALFK